MSMPLALLCMGLPYSTLTVKIFRNLLPYPNGYSLYLYRYMWGRGADEGGGGKLGGGKYDSRLGNSRQRKIETTSLVWGTFDPDASPM